MKGIFSRGSTFIKYFFSYVLILAVSLAGLYFVVHFQLRNEYEKIYSKENESKLNNINNMFSKNIMDILQTHELLEADINIIFARYTNNDYLRYIAVNELKKFITSDALVQDVFFIDKNNKDVFSTIYRCLYEDGKFYINLPKQFINIPDVLINSDEYNSKIYILSNPSQTFYLFTPPCRSDNYRIVYVLNESELRALLNICVSSSLPVVGLVDNKNQIILSNDASALTQTLKKLPDKKNKVTQIDNTTDIYYSYTGINSINLVACSDRDFMQKSVNMIFKNSYIIIFCIAMLGIFITFISMKITYSPLHRLRRRITQNSGNIGNDITALSEAFHISQEEKDNLMKKINKYKSMIQKTILLSQSEANGFVSSQLDVAIDELFDPTFSFVIFVMKVLFENDPENKTVMEFTEKNLPQDTICILLESKPKQLSLLIGCPNLKNEIDIAIEQFFQNMQKSFQCKIAFSDYSTNPMDIARLYDNVTLAQKFWDSKSIIGYDHIKDSADNILHLPYPYKIFDELVFHLEKLDFEKAQTTIDTLFYTIDMKNSPELFVRCILIDALTLISTYMNQNDIKFNKYNMVFSETLYLCRNSQYNETKSEICSSMKSMLSIFSAEITNSNIQASHIKQFVQENYLNPTFSITVLADHFHISVAYMSFLFKKKFDINFSDYVWKLRFEKAKKLLETTNDSIEQISLAVGYDNSSSFRRKFKEKTGVSPSQYKKDI